MPQAPPPSALTHCSAAIIWGGELRKSRSNIFRTSAKVLAPPSCFHQKISKMGMLNFLTAREAPDGEFSYEPGPASPMLREKKSKPTSSLPATILNHDSFWD